MCPCHGLLAADKAPRPSRPPQRRTGTRSENFAAAIAARRRTEGDEMAQALLGVLTILNDNMKGNGHENDR